MQDEIREIIKKHLPAEVGETLKGVLRQGEEDARTCKSQEKDLLKKDAAIKELEEIRDEQKKFVDRVHDIEGQAKKLRLEQEKMESFNLRCRLSAAESTNQKIMDFVQALMRNTSFKRTKYNDYMPSNEYDQYGMPIQKISGINEEQVAE